MEFGFFDEIELNRRTALLALLAVGTHARIPAWAVEGESTVNDLPTTLEAKVTHFLENRNRPTPRSASRELYSGLSRDELTRLLAHARADIAMRAAWEFVQRDGTNPTIVSQFLETTGRALRVQPPEWWEEAIRTAKLKKNDPRLLEINTKLYPPYLLGTEGWFLQRHQKLRSKNRELQLFVGNRSLPISTAMIERQKKRRESANCLVANITDEAAFLVCHAGLDSFVPLWRVDPDAGDIIWEAETWVGACGFTETGIVTRASRGGTYTVTLMHDAGRILIFGADPIQAHVEGFRVTDGENLFRFCTMV